MATTINANLRINTSAAYSDIDVFKSRINKSFSQPLGRISGDAAEFSKSLQAAAARVTAFGATTGSIYLVSKAISETARATIEVNKQLTELNTFLGESQSNLNNFSKSLFSIARNTGATFSDATEAAKEFARQGLSTQETLTRTNDALVLSRISGLNYAQSVNSITTALNGFSKEALTSTEIINKLIAVDTRFAVSSRDLSEALTRVGSAAEEAGLSSDQLVATITAAQQITGRGGAVIGNALKTIFTRVRRPEILDQLKQIGVVVNDQNGSLLNAIDILKNYTNVTKNLSQAEKSRTAELLGGVYQINQLQSVIRDLGSANSIYANSLKISIGATDEAIKKNAELNKSYAALITETKTVALQAGADIGKSLFGPLISSGAGLTKTILGFLSPESIEPEISKTGQKIGNTLSKEIGRGVLDTLGNALVFVGAPVAAVVAGVIGKRLKNFLSASVKTQIKEVTDPLGRVITGGSYSGEKEKEQINLQNQIADVIKKRNFIGQATVKGVYDEGQARREVLKEILAQNAQLEKQAKLASTIYSTVSKIKPTVTNLSQVNAFGANQAVPRRDSRGRFIASGYIPAFGDAEKEVAMAKGYGAKNPKAQLIQATIKGKTQSVMVNSEEDVIPNFAGTRETAIIPRYRNVKDIPRMGSGYVPNFSSTSGSFGSVSRINESQVRKTFFSGAGQSGAGEIANEFLASRKLSEQIQASRELGYQGMRGGYIGKLFQAPNTYGTLEESIRSGSIVKSLAPGKTAKEIGDNLDKYTGEYKNYYELVTNLGRLSAKQINSGKTMEARDLANFGNLMLNKKAEDLITKIVARKGGERLVGKMNSSWQTTSRVAEALARQGARISIVDPGIFGGLDKKRKKELGKLGYEDNYREMTGVNAAGYIPNFAKKDKYKFPSISSAKMEANIGRNFEKLSPGDQKYFARAYEDYNNLINVFSKASGTSPEKFANVMSALSPANPLERNALDALRYNLFTKKKLSTIASPIFLDEREIASVKAQTYGANRSKAANLLVGLEKLTGNKRKAFLNNMLDPFGSQDVTVDYRAQGDALNKKFNVKNAPTMNREQYDKVSQAFRNVGSRAGVSGLGVQAATWIGGRMGSKAAKGQDLNRGILKFFYDNPDKISLENLEFLLNVPGKGKARSDFFKKASAMGVSKLGSDSLISISRAGGYIPNFALPADAVLRHYYKKAKKASRSNYKNWKGYGFWDSMGQYNENPMLVRGTRSPEIEELLKSGQFQSQWAELGGAKSGTKATWVTSNFETANLYANRKSRNMFVQSEQDKDLQRGSPMIAGLSKGLRNDKNVFWDTAQGDSGSNFGALNPILDSDVRAIFKYKLGKRGPVPLSLKEIKQMAGIVPEDLLQIASGYIPNFAGLSNAVSREKTMTGLPVSQIMAHFDKSGNPIAVTNKKDEPNGLKDVVPNFAPRVRVPKGAKGPKGATAAEASDLFGSFVNNFIYGGLFQSVLSTLTDRELVSETVNEAVQTGLPLAIAGFQARKSYKASAGQKPGVRALAAGIPVALGAAQAGLGFFSSKSVGEDLQRRKLEKESDRAAKEFKDLTEGTQELSDTLSKLNEAFKDATTSPEQLSNLSKRTSELTRNITKNNPALAASISSEPNIERKINLIEDARRNASQKQAVQQEIIQFKGLTKRSPEDLINLFSKQISLANDKLLQVSKQDLIPQNLDKILAEADLQPLADFFKLQKEEVKNKLVPAFIEAVKSEIDYNKINKENIKKIKSLRSEEIKARNEIEGQRVRRQASSEALRAGAEELKPFAGQFGARAAISFDADLQKTKESITAITSFRNQVNTKLIDKELKLPSNVVDRLKGIETPGQEAGAVLSELSKTSNLNEKQKEALDELIAANANQSKELKKIADISEINKNAQLRVLTIQEKLNYGGGIKTTTDARSRIESINAPIKGLLENRLGTMLGSERSQTSGMVNVLKSIKDLYPGLIENSKALGGVRDRLTNLRAGDLQKDLLRNASLLQSAGGYGDLPGLLRAKAFDSEGLKNLAATQAEAELSGGGTPQEGARYLADVIKDAVSSLNQRMVDDQTIKNLEEQTRLPVQKINEETEAARQKFLNSLTESVKTAFGENIQVQTVNIPNANVNITQSSAYQSGESSGAAQARASMTTMASGASGPRSKGFIPSFYNPLREAIQRESQYVPFNSIRVNKSNKLVNQNNPLGLAVTNTIDEPNGLASIGLASRGYVPNFASKSKVLDKVLKNETLYGSKISKEAQRLAKKGQLWGLDYAASDPAKGDYILYKIKPNGSLGERGMPNKGDTVLSHVAASKFLGGVKDLLPISKLAEPPKSQEASLAGGTILPTSSIDKIIRDVKKKGGSATDLQKAVETFAQQNLSTSNFLIKTGVGNLSIQSKGVFGINSKPLDSSAYGTILNDYGRGKGKSSDFFIQEKAQLSGQHNESRVHVAIDGKGNAKLVRNGTIDKSTGGNLAKGSYRRAAERAALQAAEAFVKANPKLAKNQFLGLDVGAVAATEGKRLGLTTKTFSELGQKFNPIVFEINPTNRRGSQGGSGFVSAENAFSKASPSVFNSILSRLGVKADNKLVQSNVLEALSKGVMGNDTLLGSVKNKIADTNIPFPNSFFGKVKGAFSSSSSKVKSLFQNAGAKISNLGNSVFGSVGSKFSGVTDKIGAGLSGLTGKVKGGLGGMGTGLSGSSGRAKEGFSGGLAALGLFGNMQQMEEDQRAGRNLEASLSTLAAISAAPSLASSLVNFAFGKPKVPGLMDKVSPKGLQAASVFSTAAESAREFRAGNYGLSSVKGAEAAAYAASIFEGAGKALPKGKGILGSLGNITPKALSQAGGKAFGIGSALGLGTEIATAKDNAIAEDYSDILFGKKDEYIDPETGEVTKSRSILGAGFDLYGTAMGAIAGGPIGKGVAVAKVGYRAGNVIENKLGIGEKLGKIYEDKINKERAGEIAGAEARLKAKKEGFKDREAFAANIAKIEAETEKARQEIRSKGRKDISEVYKRAEADKEKNDKDRTSFLRKRIVGDIIKNEEANGLSTSKDRANYLMSQEAIYGKFKPEEFADKELYKSYKAYSKEKETTQAREQKFNSAVMNPEMAGSQTYKVDQFRAEAERQSAMLASVPKDALEEAVRRGVSVEQVMEERRKVNKSRGFVPNFSNAYNREKLDILRNPDYSGYRNAVPQPSKYYKNIVKNSAEIEVPAVEVYNRMGYFGATPKNPSEQYAILNPAQQAKLGYASGGFVPNFAAEQFAGAVSDAMQKALSPLIDKVGTSVSNSNVINVSDQRSYQTSTDQIAGIMEFLYSQFPKEMGRKMGPKLV